MLSQILCAGMPYYYGPSYIIYIIDFKVHENFDYPNPDYLSIQLLRINCAYKNACVCDVKLF